MTTTDKLPTPCFICGGTNVYAHELHDKWRIHCQHCGTNLAVNHATRDAAVAEWGRVAGWRGALQWISNLSDTHIQHAVQEFSWRSFAERVKDKAQAALEVNDD